MKLIYISSMDLDAHGSFGIRKKVFAQINTMKATGFNVDLFFSSKTGIVCYCANKERKEINYNNYHKTKTARFNNFIMSNIDLSDYDIAYIRLDYFSFSFDNLLRFVKKNNVKILLEIPTYPYRGEVKERAKKNIVQGNKLLGFRLYLSLLEDKFFSLFSKKYVDRVVTFSTDKIINGIKAINISNGIETNKISVNTRLNIDKKSLTLIAVSTLNNWHGYDRLIKGMEEYYSGSPEVETEVFLYIVGDGEELINYKKMVDEANIQDYVFFTGMLDESELNRVYNEADIAIDSLGRHRVGVYYNSSIKGKEYLAKGLPIVSGVETELDYYDNIPFYKRVNSNDDPICIEEIIFFYKKLIDVYKSKVDLTSQIRNYSEKKFDYSVTMLPVLNYITNRND